ncbi:MULTISPECIES: hypothetical protein [Acinetobacter]|uniref:hypothetical protein n=1 Tax=Acinetobacter TaxID=469 RepID=UPI0008F4F7F9|nr:MULTISPECIES: hypothetical protein [Acinetobacter]OIJ32249.1 hypothetical protein BK820_14745 [Acinetobacter sp. LCT-H3]
MSKTIVLAKAVKNAAKYLSLNKTQLKKVLNLLDEDFVELDPSSPSGQNAILLIKIYQSLYVLNGGDPVWMKRCMINKNHSTGGIPIDQIQEQEGLVKVLRVFQYLSSKN